MCSKVQKVPFEDIVLVPKKMPPLAKDLRFWTYAVIPYGTTILPFLEHCVMCARGNPLYIVLFIVFGHTFVYFSSNVCILLKPQG